MQEEQKDDNEATARHLGAAQCEDINQLYQTSPDFCWHDCSSSSQVGEEYSPQCLEKNVKHPTSVMVWSMMSVHGVGRLYMVEGRVNQHQHIRLLEQKLLTELPKHFPNGGALVQQDGAPCHTAKSVKDF